MVKTKRCTYNFTFIYVAIGNTKSDEMFHNSIGFIYCGQQKMVIKEVILLEMEKSIIEDYKKSF